MSGQLPEGTVTILFTDVVGSTGLRTSRGDAAAHQIMRAHFDLVRREIEQNGGREVKTAGDGFMVAFASARKAVACASGVQQALAVHNLRRPADAVQVRIGLNTGEAIQEDGDLFGAAVDAASRIAAKATAGQVLVSEAVRSVIGPGTDIRFADRGRFRLKGFPERWRLYEVVWQDEAAAAPVLAERTPFVGREPERAELRRLQEQAAGGQGSLVLISGEPGIGKTRLAQELMAEARERGMTALLGRCYEMEGSPPYIPFVEMLEAAARLFPLDALGDALGESAPEVATLMPELRRLFPDIPSPPQLPPEQERRYLFNGMLDFLGRAARVQPMLLVLDDLHWADDSTLLLLRHVAGQMAEMPLLLAGTYRDVEVEAGSPLARTLEELVRQRLAQRMSLRRLPEAGVESMLRAFSGREPPPSLVQVVYGETEGNPFFVEEVFKHLAEEGKLLDAEGGFRSNLRVDELAVPEGVRLVLGRRLQRGSEGCRRVLTAAAVAGRAFSFELLDALGVVEADALLDAVDEAERAHLIVSGADGADAQFTFAHELIRQTLLTELSPPRRQRMHLRVAEAMERVHAHDVDEHAADLAYHFQQAVRAADPEKTAHYLTLAAEHALAQAAYEEAVRLYETAIQALDRMEAPDEAQRCELLLGLGDARWKAGEPDGARATFWKAADVARRAKAPEGLARAALGYSREALTHVQKEMIPLLEEASGALGGKDTVLKAMVDARLASALYWGDEPDRGERSAALGRQAVAMSRRLADKPALMYALDQRHDSTWDIWEPTTVEERLAIAIELVELAQQCGDTELLMHSHNDRFHDLLQLGDLAAAKVEQETSARLAKELRIPWYLWQTPFVEAMWAMLDGRFQESERLARQGLTLGRGIRPVQAAGHFAVQMFVLRREQGQINEADVEGSMRFLQQHPPDPPSVLAWRAGLAVAYSELGRSAMCRAEFEALAADDFRDLPAAAPLSGVALLSEVCTLLGDGRRAAVLYEIMSRHSTYNVVVRGAGSGGVAYYGCASRYLGLLATTMRRWEDAERHFQYALEMNTRMGARPWVAWTQHDCARMLLARHRKGDRGRALKLLTPALEAAQEMGMKRLEEKAQGLLDRLHGVTPPNPAGLSDREVEVLRLIACGKSNQQIAQELVISLNTVARHVSSIFDKTGAANRTEAAAFANRHGLVQNA